MTTPIHLTSLRSGLRAGYNGLLDRQDDPGVGQDFDFGVHRLAAGETLRSDHGDTERALLVIKGSGTLEADGHSLPFHRPDWLQQGPFAVHGPAGAALTVRAGTDCEVAQVGTANSASFEPRLFTPDDVFTEHRGKGMLEGACYRLVRAVFDGESSPPQCRLVLGEVIAFPGRWSSYPPHHHAQPEIYYYRFSPAQGYGHGEMGQQVFLLKDHDLLRITGGNDHAQVAAPGYHMYYIWAIRHLDDDPYRGFEFNPDHQWLLEKKE